MTILGLLLAAFSPVIGWSAAPLRCENPLVLRPQVKECATNAVYTAAAKKCIADFEAAVDASRVSVAKALEKIPAGASQAKGMKDARAGYDLAVSELTKLGSQGKALQLQIAAYKNEVVLPEDFASIGPSGFDPQVFLDNNPCYKDTQDLLGTYEEIMGSLSKEVSLSAEVSGRLAARAFRGEENLSAETALPQLSPGHGKSGGGKKGKAEKDSDISGTEKEKQAK